MTLGKRSGWPPVGRCLVFNVPKGVNGPWYQCVNEGTHVEVTPGCPCHEKDEDVCIGPMETWECDGPHVYDEVASD